MQPGFSNFRCVKLAKGDAVAPHTEVPSQFAGISMSISWLTCTFQELMDALAVNCGSGLSWSAMHCFSPGPHAELQLCKGTAVTKRTVENTAPVRRITQRTAWGRRMG